MFHFYNFCFRNFPYSSEEIDFLVKEMVYVLKVCLTIEIGQALLRKL